MATGVGWGPANGGLTDGHTGGRAAKSGVGRLEVRSEYPENTPKPPPRRDDWSVRRCHPFAARRLAAQ